jgi:hypothetical protein
MTNKMPCRITDEHRPNPHENCMTAAEEIESEERAQRVNDLVWNYLADEDAIMEVLEDGDEATSLIASAIATFFTESRYVHDSSRRIANRNILAGDITEALTDVFVERAKREDLEEYPISADGELERADRERDR